MKKALALALAALMLLFVFGCSQPAAPDDEPGTTQAGSGEPGGTEADIPTRDNNILTFATRGAIAGMFHPDFSVTSGEDRVICFVLYEPLVRLGANNELKGVLAESWEISDDQRTITFHLREGVKWHDGEDFTAEDVAYTYTACASEGWMGYFTAGPSHIEGVEAYRSGEADSISGINIIDDYTIAITTEDVYGAFFYQIGELVSIVPEHIWGDVPAAEAHERTDLLHNPVGTGPFKFTEYEPDQYVILDKFADYWNGEPKIDQMVFKPMNAEIGPSAVVSGEADMHQTSSMNPETINMLTEAGCEIQELWWTSIRYLILNNDHPLFQTKEARQAMAYAIDRYGIAENIFYGYGRVENTCYAADQWGTPPADQINPYEYNPEKAKELLVAAGCEYQGDTLYLNGEPVTLDFIHPTGNANVEKIAVVIQQNLKDIGIDVSVTPMEMASHNALTASGDFDMAMIGNGSVDPDMTWIYASDGSSNYENFSDPYVDELLEEGLKYVDQEKREPIYQELAIYLNDVMPMVPIVSWCDGLIIAPGLEGVKAEEEAAYMFANPENWYFSNLAE